jgi:hypothetical protein
MCLSKTYSKVRIGKHLPGTLPIQNGLQQRDTLYLLLLTFASAYDIKKVPRNQEGMQLNGIHHLLVCTNDDVLEDDIDTIDRKAETLTK